MYGQSPYGWQGRSSDVIELPLAPVRRRNDGADCRNCGCINWFTFGVILSILAAASLSLGVADVVVTYQNYMVDKDCGSMTTMMPCMMNSLVWTWVASGIWGSILPFVLGIMAIRRASNPTTRDSWFELAAFLSTFIFTPAMIVLSAIEIWKGMDVYYWTYMAPATEDDMVKFGIPLAIAILAFIEHLMTFIVVGYICGCCDGGAHAQQQVNMMAPPQVVTTKPQCNSCVKPVSAVYNAGPSAGCGCRGGATSNFQIASPMRPSSYNYYSGAGAGAGVSPYRMGGTPNSAYNFFRG